MPIVYFWTKQRNPDAPGHFERKTQNSCKKCISKKKNHGNCSFLKPQKKIHASGIRPVQTPVCSITEQRFHICPISIFCTPSFMLATACPEASSFMKGFLLSTIDSQPDVRKAAQQNAISAGLLLQQETTRLCAAAIDAARLFAGGLVRSNHESAAVLFYCSFLSRSCYCSAKM